MENVCCISLEKTAVHKGSRKNSPGKNAPRKEICPRGKISPGKFVNLPYVMECYKGENFVSFNFR